MQPYIRKITKTAVLLLSFMFTGSIPDKPYAELKGKSVDLKEVAEPAITVEMTNTMKFTPDTVRISTGETVIWENTSLLAHSVTGDPAVSTIEGSVSLPDGAVPFNSDMMDPEQTFTHTFDTPGTYQYFCIPHEGAKMYGWVIVE